MGVVVVIAAYLQDCEVRGMSPRSLPGYKSALKDFSSYLNYIKTDRQERSKKLPGALQEERSISEEHRAYLFSAIHLL